MIWRCCNPQLWSKTRPGQSPMCSARCSVSHGRQPPADIEQPFTRVDLAGCSTPFPPPTLHTAEPASPATLRSIFWAQVTPPLLVPARCIHCTSAVLESKRKAKHLCDRLVSQFRHHSPTHMLGLEVGALCGRSDLLKPWLLKHQQRVAVCALARFRAHVLHNKVTLAQAGRQAAAAAAVGRGAKEQQQRHHPMQASTAHTQHQCVRC
jgi:hypothetical protein